MLDNTSSKIRNWLIRHIKGGGLENQEIPSETFYATGRVFMGLSGLRLDGLPMFLDPWFRLQAVSKEPSVLNYVETINHKPYSSVKELKLAWFVEFQMGARWVVHTHILKFRRISKPYLYDGQ